MKILQINKFLWLSGGVERYMFDLASCLESDGHEVVYFAMQDEARNRACDQSGYFVSNIDYKGGGGIQRAVGAVSKTVYSLESKRNIRRLLRDLKPDVAHIHTIDHQISPSILPVLREEGVPAVQTVHDFKLVCPNYRLYVPRSEEVCERCLPGTFHHCVTQRCMKDSLAASALATGAMYLHTGTGIVQKNIHRFLCATRFLAGKLEEGGIPAAKLRRQPLYLDLARYEMHEEPEEYYVYAGRLVIEKGLRTLLRAAAQTPRHRLLLVGAGDARTELEAFVEDQGITNVRFAGYHDGEALTRLIARARFLVLPSEAYETCGLVLWEANALRRPVIGARRGGIPESVDEDETGLLFEAGDADELAAKIAWMFEHADRAREMGEAGRKRVESSCESHGGQIIAHYEEAMAGH